MSSNENNKGRDNELIAIIGLGGCFPDAADIPSFWENICRGHVAIKEVPAERWDPELYYSDDRKAPDRTYSKIGAFVSEIPFDRKKFRMPPRTAVHVDDTQKMALTAVAEALHDAGLEAFPDSGVGRSFGRERTAVILGNSMGGQSEDLTNLRVWFPQVKKTLLESEAMSSLSPALRDSILVELEQRYKATLPQVTEDSMPGELSNCIAGRVANAFNLRGPNYTTDAACAASMAAMKTAVDGLRLGDYDMAIVGGSDQQMDPPTYVKFSKIGALSAQHSVPFDERADGFVMGEGAGVLVLKRLSDAERDGDRVYAVIRGVGAASDGKGKGITAPNPIGQKLAVERAYETAGVGLDSVGLFEAHGTSTKVGDRVELQVLTDLLREASKEPNSVPIGSVKSMIGHLKSAAGAAALIKSTLSLYHEKLPPSANFRSAASDSPLSEGYLKVNTQLRDWPQHLNPRRAGVSAFGFGGTNFHVVLEEYRGGTDTSVMLTPKGAAVATTTSPAGAAMASSSGGRASVLAELTQLFAEQTGYEVDELDSNYQLEADLGIDTVKQAEIFAIIRERYQLPQSEDFKLSDVQTLELVTDYVLGNRTESATEEVVLASTEEEIVAPSGPTVIAFGGSTREELLNNARAISAAAVSFPADFDQARRDAVGFPCRLAFVAESIEEVEKKIGDAEKRSSRILAARGIYFTEGDEEQSGKVAFLFPGQGSQYVGMLRDLAELYPVVRETFEEANEILRPLIGGRVLTDIVWPEGVDAKDKAAAAALQQTEICQPAMLTADIALMRLLQTFGISPDYVVGHSLGEYAACVAAGVMSFADALYAVSARGREMAGVEVEDCGKMASVPLEAGAVEEVLAEVEGYVIAANKNCRKQTVIAGASVAVESAVAKFAEKGVDARLIPVSHAFHCEIVAPAAKPLARVLEGLDLQAPALPILSNVHAGLYPTDKQEIVALLAKQLESPVEFIAQLEELYSQGVRTFVEVGPRRAITGFVHNVFEGKPYVGVFTNHHKKAGQLGFLEALSAISAGGHDIDFTGTTQPKVTAESVAHEEAVATDAPKTLKRTKDDDQLVVSGVSVALPCPRPVGEEGEDVFSSILRGDNFISNISEEHRQEILDKNVVRLEKSSGEFSRMTELGQVIQLAGQLGEIDLVKEYGIDANFNDALDTTSRLAIAVGVEALKDAGVPLIRRYRTTSTGKKLADGWALPPQIGKRTGVIFASAFPGLNRVIEDVSEHVASKYAAESADSLHGLVESLASVVSPAEGDKIRSHFSEHLESLREEAGLYAFNRKFLFRILSMGHAQLAQVIGAQGPNTQVNAACASGAQAIAIGTDWIAQGRCDRVIVVTADDVTHPSTLPWIGTGFLAAGAATTEHDPTKAALPFGAKRDGMIVGSGAACFVLERDSMVSERGMTPLVDVLATSFTNTAFHATRLESGFIRDSFTDFVAEVASKTDMSVEELGREAFFMSHETYTPARGGSSAAEVNALREAFQGVASEVLIANTKGFTGHPMGASLEDAVAIKGLQRQELPPVANLNEVDPEFSDLHFSSGGTIKRSVAIRFAAGFGSQVAMVAYGRRATEEARLVDEDAFQQWIARESGTEGATYEVTHRTFRVAESGGKRLNELGVPSLKLVEKQPEQAVVEAIVVEEKAEQTVAVPSSISREELAQQITALFAEQTGYEPEELEPSFLLEADLGIDTVKQAEIFGILRENYGMSRDESFNLSDVQTLTAVVDYVLGQLGEVTSASAPSAATEATESKEVVEAAPAPIVEKAVAKLGLDELLLELTALFAEQTGYEPDELEPDYQLEADLGIDTVKQAEIFAIIRERYDIGQDDSFELSAVQTLRAVADYVSGAMGGAEVVEATAAVKVVEPEATPIVEAVAVSEEVSTGDLLTELTQLFAEQTGYEPDELEPTYQLEADLGIDTVKQAEIFGIIRERYGIGQDDNFDLSSVQTLTAVVDYVRKQVSQPTAPRAEVSRPSAVDTVPVAAQSRDRILKELTELFATETGYETDELDPGYQLEADLGIDTVKQAEIFSILRTRYELPQDDDFTLADYQTLHAIADYIMSMLEGPQDPTPGARSEVSKPEPKSLDLASFSAREVGVVHSPKPVPSTVSVEGQSWLIVCKDEVVAEALRLELQVRGATHVETTTSVAAALNRFQRNGKVDGFAWLAHGSPVNRTTLADVFEMVRTFATARKGDFDGTSMLLAAPTDGVFGHYQAKGTYSLTPGLSGIAKSMTKEWPNGRALVVDLDASVKDPRKVAKLLMDELAIDGSIETAIYQGQRLTLERTASAELDGSLAHTDGTVVATGGARGVTFEVLREIAKLSPRKMVILARTLGVAKEASPIVGRNDSELKAIAKAALQGKVERITPVAVKRWIEKEEKKLEVTENLDALRALGCEVVSVRCDTSDAAGLSQVLKAVRAEHGQVELLVHGSGIEESKYIQDKDIDAFDRTFRPKVDALDTLVEVLKPTRTLCMGSVAGRFGNAGQADYSAANESMGGMARCTNSGMLNVCWTAWADVGMATRGSVGRVLSDLGVELLPARLGAQIGARLALSNVTGDVVVAGALGGFAGREQANPRRFEASAAKFSLPAIFERYESTEQGGLYGRVFDPTKDVGLRDHSIDGVPLLPGVMGVELMTQAAEHFAQSPVTGLRGVEFSSPIKFFENRAQEVCVEVVEEDAGSVRAEVVTYFKRPNGKLMRRKHFEGTALTVAHGSVPELPNRLEMPRDPQLSQKAIYERYFHGPAFQVLSEVSRLGEDGVELEMDLKRAEWLLDYSKMGFVTEPHMREVGFQAAGIWEMAELSRMGLPSAVEHIFLSSQPIPANARVSVRRRACGGEGATFDVWVHDGAGNIFEMMQGYRTATLRALRREERFEPVTAQAEVPDWVTVKITDVEAMLDSEREATLQKYLSEEEKKTFLGLKTSKRRRDWLAGRIAAKRLIREEHFGRDGAIVPYAAISIVPDPLGAPTVVIVGEGILPIRISISHSDGIAAALLSVDSKVRPGIDVEVIEARHASWAESYFTAEERSWAESSENPQESFTSMWAIKEAYLKALGIGARVDFRDMSIGYDGANWHIETTGGVEARKDELQGRDALIRVEVSATRVVARVFLTTTAASTNRRNDGRANPKRDGRSH